MEPATSAPPPPTQPRAGPLLLASLRLYRDNFLLFLLIAITGRALFIAGDLFAIAGPLTGLTWLRWVGRALLAPAAVMGFWAGAALIVATSRTYRRQGIGLAESLAAVGGPYWNYVAAVVLYHLACAAGLLLLVLPGLYLGIVLCLAGYVAVLEGTSGLAALKRSRQLVHGSVWCAFMVMFILTLVLWAPSFALSTVQEACYGLGRVAANVYSILVWPFWTAAHTVLYHRLAEGGKQAQQAQVAAVPRSEMRGCLPAFLSAVGLVAVIAVLWVGWATALAYLFP